MDLEHLEDPKDIQDLEDLQYPEELEDLEDLEGHEDIRGKWRIFVIYYTLYSMDPQKTHYIFPPQTCQKTTNGRKKKRVYSPPNSRSTAP